MSRVVYLPTLLCVFLSGLMNMPWELYLTFDVVAQKLCIGSRQQEEEGTIALGLLNLNLLI